MHRFECRNRQRRHAEPAKEAPMPEKLKQHQKKDSDKTQATKKHLDDELTRALKDTFPASDPPAVTQPPHSHYDKDKV
jgi:hypothetical protein